MLSAHVVNPFPPEDRGEVHIITPAQERQILARAQDIRHGDRTLRFWQTYKGLRHFKLAHMGGWKPGAFRLYFAVMMRQGLRPAEARCLRWDELFLDAKVPVMRLRRIIDQEGATVRSLKTNKSMDTVTLAKPSTFRDVWRGACDDLDIAEELRDFRKHADGPCVFGPRLNEHEIFRALKRELADDGLRPYSCRHTLATRMIARGFTLEDVSRVLRNSVAVCEKYYCAGTRVHDAFDVATGRRIQIA